MRRKIGSGSVHEGNLYIGDLSIPCAVLENGERVVSRKGIANLLGRKIGGRAYEKGTTLIASNLKEYTTKEFNYIMDNPIKYKSGRQNYSGFKADIIPKTCEIWLKAKDENALTDSQKPIARQAEIVMRALAQVGIISLIDEATGYQNVRDSEELRKILDTYLKKEFSSWAKRFPDEFYQHIFRLRNWKWKGMEINRPQAQAVARYTTDLIYARLAPGIHEELKKLNPINPSKGNRRSKHHQWLTEEVGHPQLAQHIYAVMALMRASKTWEEFKRIVDTSLPKQPETLQIPSMIDVYSSSDNEQHDELSQKRFSQSTEG